MRTSGCTEERMDAQRWGCILDCARMELSAGNAASYRSGRRDREADCEMYESSRVEACESRLIADFAAALQTYSMLCTVSASSNTTESLPTSCLMEACFPASCAQSAIAKGMIYMIYADTMSSDALTTVPQHPH